MAHRGRRRSNNEQIADASIILEAKRKVLEGFSSSSGFLWVSKGLFGSFSSPKMGFGVGGFRSIERLGGPNEPGD